jgi:uncharacterized protein
MSLREQLKLLEELQQHDARLQEMESIRVSLPKKLAENQAALGELQKILEKERAELAENESFHRDQAAGQKDTAEQLSRSKMRMNVVRNNKETLAAQKEIDQANKQLESRTEEMQKLGAALQEQRQKIAAQEQKLQSDLDELKGQEADVNRRLQELEAQMSAARVEREVAAARLRPDVLKRYSAIRMKRGLAVVPVKDGTCRGCNMNIPPQLYNVLQRGTTLELCPTCNRIIYWSKLLEEEKAS